MNLVQLLYFIIVFGGLGYILLELLKIQTKGLLEKFFISIGIGTAGFVVLAAIFDITHLPQHWLSYLIITTGGLIFVGIRSRNKPESKKNINEVLKGIDIFDILVLILFLVNLFVFAGASLQQPALEDDDPWGVAINSKYVQDYKTYDSQTHNWTDGRSEPYAQGYHVIMGVLAQTSDNLPQTLKIYNSLFAALAIVFAYIWLRKLTQNSLFGFLGAFALFANPSFTSRFIWAEALAISLLLLMLYFIADRPLKRNRSTRVEHLLAGAVIGAISIIHQRTFIIALVLLFFYYIITGAILWRQQTPTKEIIFNKAFFAGIAGLVTGLLYWGMQMIKFGGPAGIVHERASAMAKPYWSKATINIGEYFQVFKVNDMGNPAGIGLFLAGIALIGLIILLVKNKNYLSKEAKWFSIIFFLSFLFFHQGGRLYTSPLPIITLWKILAIPTAILFAYALIRAKELPFLKEKQHHLIFIIVILVIILFTSGAAKYTVTTSTWPPGSLWIGGYDAVTPYLQLQEADPGARIFTIGSDNKVAGLGFQTDFIAQDHKEMKWDAMLGRTSEIYSFLKAHNYEYFIVDSEVIKYIDNQTQGIDWLNKLLQQAQANPQFILMYQSQNTFVFKVQ